MIIIRVGKKVKGKYPVDIVNVLNNKLSAVTYHDSMRQVKEEIWKALDDWQKTK